MYKNPTKSIEDGSHMPQGRPSINPKAFVWTGQREHTDMTVVREGELTFMRLKRNPLKDMAINMPMKMSDTYCKIDAHISEMGDNRPLETQTILQQGEQSKT